MKTAYWIVCLILQAVTVSAQIGTGDSLGIATIVAPSSIGGGLAPGSSSLPKCNSSMTTCATILPLNWLNFGGHRENAAYVSLDWTTTSELSNTGFWVQRSFGNASNFKAVFFVPAMQNTDLQKHYQTPDTNAYTGNTFYRLQQIDLDGKGTYSKTIEIDGYPVNETLTVYPNPGRDIIYLQYPPSPDGTLYPVSVYDNYGRLVYSGRTTTIDLSGKAAGNYFIRMEGNQPKHAQVILLK